MGLSCWAINVNCCAALPFVVVHNFNQKAICARRIFIITRIICASYRINHVICLNVALSPLTLSKACCQHVQFLIARLLIAESSSTQITHSLAGSCSSSQKLLQADHIRLEDSPLIEYTHQLGARNCTTAHTFARTRSEFRSSHRPISELD